MLSIQKEVNNTLSSLKEGKIILYPTDTVWGIGCDATNNEAVKKIYTLKKRTESKSMIVLVDSVEMLKAIIPNISTAILIVISSTKTPTSFIFNKPKGLAVNVIAQDQTVAIRIVNDTFCKKLIQTFGKPIISTSANVSGEQTPKIFSEIQAEIKDNVDYIVDLHRQKQSTKASRIIKIHKDGTFEVLRN